VDPEYLLGNIGVSNIEDLVSGRQQFGFGRDKRDSLPRFCLECDVRFACHGECPKNRFVTTPDGEPGLNYLCAGYKDFFHHIGAPMRRMIELMRSGRPAAEVMDLLAAEDRAFQDEVRRAGRNDPCPCGSGLKVKRCHGRAPDEAEVRPLPTLTGTPRPPVVDRGQRTAERWSSNAEGAD